MKKKSAKKKKAIPRDKWVWMGHPAHFICAKDCQFFMATRVGKYIISTVGEMFPDETVREIFAKSRGVNLKGMGDERRNDYMNKIGFEEIGYGRKYETMVFPCYKDTSKKACVGCPYHVSDWSNLDQDGYNSPKDAFDGHNKMCKKWSKKQ